MFHIKICGVRLKEDLDAAADAGADAIGLNFFPASVRYVDPLDPHTLELAQHAAARNLTRVGVFVNEPVKSVVDIAKRLDLNVVQLHGDEPINDVIWLIRRRLRVLRAIKLPAGELDVFEITLKTFPPQRAGAGLLLDTDAGSAHGGSGQTLDWNSIRDWAEVNRRSNWVLAGGLNPENVSEAIRTSGATRVDVASGVEEPRGMKSSDRVRAFSMNAQQAFATNEQ